ncbi:hypothetical protein DH2020_021531 [Rehmannia glutinosa]|uniref:C2 NT-type domain-containing protein n=1 Tax=Rehmannia glutinosa TaxID=99300 RepID=A0ABR0WAQ2_REHGL
MMERERWGWSKEEKNEESASYEKDEEMIRERIFRLHRHKSSSSSGQKFDFTFSNIQALQVPKGWDKVYLSLISSESGKTARKSGKVPVKNGTCKWTETFSESVWISDTDSSKEMDEHLFKFLVSMGSSRSILGETTLNLVAFLGSESPVLVSLPLKKCNYGTILQVEVRCLTPKTKLRDEKRKEMHAHKHENADHDDMEDPSEISDSTVTKSVDCCSSNNLGTSSRPKELGSRETSFSASVSRYSFDSMDDSVGRQSFSSQSDRTMGNNVIFRQDSVESNDSASYCSYSTHGSIKSVRSLQRDELRKSTPSLNQNGCASKTSKEADDARIQELEAEARMWEQNARKLAIDSESLRKELSEQNAELSTSRSECHQLTQEIEQLKRLLQDSNTQKELEYENENLSLLLKKVQESNIELILILRETEETIEKQKVEIESLSADKLEIINTNEKNNRDVMVLESKLEDKIVETEIEQDLKNRILKECVVEYDHKLAASERKIKNLEAALSRARNDEIIGRLKEKVQELETDCDELTEENLELLLELKELRSDSMKKEKEIEALSNERDSMIISDSLSYVSDYKIDEMRLMETENDQTELVKHLSDLQEENIYLSQRVSGLEAQLRYLTDTNESSRLELQHSESQVMILQNQIRGLEEKIEWQKIRTKHKLSEMEKRWIGAQEECTSLSKVNVRLQITTENLIEEYNSLQKFNEELRERKSELQKQRMVVEAEARKIRDSCCNCMENIESFDASKRKSIIQELESKIELSEVERDRLADENYILRMQMQNVPELKNEVLALRLSMKELESQSQLFEVSYKSVLEDYEELKRGNISMFEKISGMQKAVLEAEDCRRKKNAMEEKILRLEGDLIARDALFVHDTEMKNEINQMKIMNSQFVMKVKHLEDVREHLQSRVQCLEEEMKQTRHAEYFNIQDNQGFVQQQVEVSNKQDSDYESRIQLLENELEKALKANDMYKSQLESSQAVASNKSEAKETIDTAKTDEYKKISQLECELQEIRERYLQISLKYAEVEAQREHLVMKLKALNS